MTIGDRLCKCVFACLLLTVSTSAFGGGKLPPPNFLPGFPMLAGPQIMMMWGPVPGAVKYVVYMNGDKVAEPTAMQHFMPAPAKAGAYAFELAAVDGEGSIGAKSAKGMVKIIKLVPPKDLRTLVRDGVLSLGWGKTHGAVIYDVYRSYEKGKQGSLIESVTELSYADPETKDAEPGKAFYYTVVAKNVAGDASKPSEQIEYLVSGESPENKRLSPIPLKTGKIWVAVHDKYSPSGKRYEMTEPNDVEVDENGERVFVSVSNNGKVVALDAETGELLMEIGAKTAETNGPNGWLARPKGIALADGRLYIADDVRKDCQVFNANTGEFIKVLPLEKRPDIPAMEEKPEPRDVLVACNGDVYVLDYRNAMILVYDSDGKFIKNIGEKGREPGNLNWPVFIRWADAGQTKFAVVNPVTSKIIFFDVQGEFMYEWGERKAAPGGFGMVSGFAFDLKRNIVYVSDVAVSMIQAFEAETGKYLGVMIDEDGETAIDVLAPLGIALGEDNSLYVPMGLCRRVGKFKLLEIPEAKKAGVSPAAETGVCR